MSVTRSSLHICFLPTLKMKGVYLCSYSITISPGGGGGVLCYWAHFNHFFQDGERAAPRRGLVCQLRGPRVVIMTQPLIVKEKRMSAPPPPPSPLSDIFRWERCCGGIVMMFDYRGGASFQSFPSDNVTQRGGGGGGDDIHVRFPFTIKGCVIITTWGALVHSITKISRLREIPTVDPVSGGFQPQDDFYFIFRLRKSQQEVKKHICPGVHTCSRYSSSGNMFSEHVLGTLSGRSYLFSVQFQREHVLGTCSRYTPFLVV